MWRCLVCVAPTFVGRADLESQRCADLACVQEHLAIFKASHHINQDQVTAPESSKQSSLMLLSDQGLAYSQCQPGAGCWALSMLSLSMLWQVLRAQGMDVWQ
jgi:hypothetical protein